MSYDSLPQITQSLLDLIKANRLILGEYMGANYVDQEIKKAQGALAFCGDLDVVLSEVQQLRREVESLRREVRILRKTR